jgi:LL-diaminopimelate aminotransferase
MVQINSDYHSLSREYIFPIIDQKLDELKKMHPEATTINLGIGDIALPLAPSIAKAIADAAWEMTKKEGKRGYGPSHGYPFLREIIAKEEYSGLGITTDEVFISDGINTDSANVEEIFSQNASVAIPDPAYPVYLDTSIMAGKKIHLLPCTEENGFLPTSPKEAYDLIFLCTPHNPTGVAMTRSQLSEWVAYAKKHQAILLVDSAYRQFVTSKDVPRTIYEIEGAKEVAIEFCSFSKSAGFTGLRCGWTVVPKTIKPKEIYQFWNTRQTIKSNGYSYPIQRGAEAAYSAEGKKETREQIAEYQTSTKILLDGIKKIGQKCYGGVDSPYIWWKVPAHLSSWIFFDLLLKECHLISIPGVGFGKHGEGYIRLSGFTEPRIAHLAIEKISQLF